MPDYQKHKDKNPLETITTIRNILGELGILLTEKWLFSSVHCCSVRISDPITGDGTNGKGTTPAYALASGYAEFMELIQNLMLYRWINSDRDKPDPIDFYFDPMEMNQTIDDLISPGSQKC